MLKMIAPGPMPPGLIADGTTQLQILLTHF